MAPPFKIILDSPHGTYFAGQTVSGRVEVTLDKPQKIKGVLFHIKGAARVQWTERTSSRSGSHSIRYYNDEHYFETKHYGVGGDNHPEFTLPVGIHIYAFSFPLPPNLPSSFEGQFGNIRYTVEAVIERSWKRNFRTKVVFTVVSHYDLNKFPNLWSTAKVNAGKQFCCWCCRSAPVTAMIQIPKTGYVSGERIPVLIEVDNASNVHIENVKLKFQQFTTFIAKHPGPKIRNDAVTFEEMKLGEVVKRGSKTWAQMVLVPPLPPSSIHECSVIDSEYQIFIEVVGSGCHTNLGLSIPIIIGTIPYNSLPPQYEAVVSSQRGTSQFGSNRTQNLPVPTQTFS